MYPNPYSHTPGDIDIWVEGGDKRVISFVRSISPHEKACYHHIEFPSYKGVEVCRGYHVYYAGGVRHACLSPYRSSE